MKCKFFYDLTIEQVKFIAESNYNYWKKVNPQLNYEESTGNIISMRENINILPMGIALIEGKQIIGFCTLRENRLKNHLNINPWLCNVMIFDEFKGKGYATKMLDFALNKFKDLGYSKVYAWTDQAPDFYKKLGWNYEGEVTKNEGGKAMFFSKKI